MRRGKITSLKDFLKAYDNKRSDFEISLMLSVPIEQIKNERKKITFNN